MKLLQICVLSASLFAGACSPSGGGGGSMAPGGQGVMTLLATDDPFAYDMVSDATIWVDEIKAHRDSGSSSGWITLFSGPPMEVDLLHLRNGVTQELASIEVPAGDYDQIRLIITSAHLSLVDGDEFSTDLDNLHLTSTSHSGLKLFISPPLHVVDGVASSAVLDFDLTKTFQAVPGNDPLNANFFMLKPVIHVADLSTTGEIRGHVREDDGAGGLIGVENATVYLLPPGETDVTLATATTATDVDGAYAFIGVAPGAHDVLADLNGRQARVDGVNVVEGNVTTVDLVLPPPTGGVSGHVTEDDGAGGFIGVANAAVYLLAPGVTDVTLAIATTATAVDGAYEFLAVDAGDYDVLADLNGRQARVNGVHVVEGSVTTVDLVLPP